MLCLGPPHPDKGPGSSGAALGPSSDETHIDVSSNKHDLPQGVPALCGPIHHMDVPILCMCACTHTHLHTYTHAVALGLFMVTGQKLGQLGASSAEPKATSRWRGDSREHAADLCLAPNCSFKDASECPLHSPCLFSPWLMFPLLAAHNHQYSTGAQRPAHSGYGVQDALPWGWVRTQPQ